jgi:hypothetical protein
MPETIAHAEPRMDASDEPGERECLLCYQGRMLGWYGCDTWDGEAETRPPAPCGGTASENPLDLCARWAGCYLSVPGDPYGDDDDDDDDFGFRYGY